MLTANNSDRERIHQIIPSAGSIMSQIAKRICEASGAGYTESVGRLLVGVDAKDLNCKVDGMGGNTALIAASDKGHTAIVKLLLDAGADTSMLDRDNWTALMHASYKGHAEVVKLLVAAGADVQFQNETWGDSALRWAAYSGHLEVVTLLLAAGADIQGQNKNGNTALKLAAHMGHAEVTQLLVAAGANKDTSDKKGRTALMDAAEEGRAEVVQLVVAAGADVHAQDEKGSTALILAAGRGGVNTIELLLAAGAGKDVQDKDGHSALMQASKRGHVEVVAQLIAAGADIHVQDKNGCTALVFACKKGHAEVVTALMAAGAYIHLRHNWNGWTALMEASCNGHAEVVKLLVDAGAYVRMRDNREGWNALMWASYNGHAEVVKLLVAADADIDAQKEDGCTALMLASGKSHAEVVKLLLAAGAAKDVQSQNRETAGSLACTQEIRDLLDYSVPKSMLAALLTPKNPAHWKDSAKVTKCFKCYATFGVLVRRHHCRKCGDVFCSKCLDKQLFIDGALRKACYACEKQWRDDLYKRIDSQRESDCAATKVPKGSTALSGSVSSSSSIPRVIEAEEVLSEHSLDLTEPSRGAIATPAGVAQLNFLLGQGGPMSEEEEHQGNTEDLLGSLDSPTTDLAITHKLTARDVEVLTTTVVRVERAGVQEVNGDYIFRDIFRDAAYFARQGVYQGQEATFTMYKCPLKNGKYQWFLSTTPPGTEPGTAADTDFYYAPATWEDKLPPSEWLCMSPDTHGHFQDPPPSVTYIHPDQVAAQDSVPDSVPQFDGSRGDPPSPANIPGALIDASDALPVGETGSPAAGASITEQDHGAIHTFLQHSTALLQGNSRLQQVMRTVAAHDRTLQMLVSKEKECPSLFWFYPKKPELRRWLSDPAKCLFQDTLMMVVVCPVTLCVVECGPDGVGWEVSKPKDWVKKWGPAILFSIYVMQAAVVAGRVVGIPLPPVPGAGEMREALGLKGMLGDVFSAGTNHVNLKDSLKTLRNTTAAELDQTPAARALCAGLQAPDADTKGDTRAPLPADLPMHMVGEAYKSMHTFLTTGENAKLGKLEDQLRGRMERVMAPDGDIEWVSVQGRDAWLQKKTTLTAETASNPVPAAVALASVSVSAGLRVDTEQVLTANYSSTPAFARELPSWLGEKLAAAGFSTDVVELCDRVLVREEGFCNEKRLARTPLGEFDRAYLTSVGISGKGLQLELLDLHRELRSKGETSPPPSTSAKNTAAAEFTEEDRQLLRQLKLQQRAPEPTTTHTVDRGNQMQLTASAFSQQGPQGAQDQQQLERRIAELEARLARTDGALCDIAADVSQQLEDVHGRVDQLTPPSSLSKGSDKRSK